MLITSDLTVIGPAWFPPGGTKTCRRRPGLSNWAPTTLEWGLAPREPTEWTIWCREGAGHTNSPLPSIMWALCCAYPETLWLYHLLSFYPAREGGSLTLCARAIWPKRKRPEYMNKGTGLLQAELKLVYYGAPFEISVGGSGKAKNWGFSPSCFLLPLPSVVWAVYFTEKLQPQGEK